MADAYHTLGGDLALSANGDLLTVAADLETQQRVLRRLLTSEGAYIWHLDYGAGLGQLIGRNADGAAITSLILSQIFEESTVAQAPEPAVSVTVNPDSTVTASITYADATTGEQKNVILQLPGAANAA